MRQSVVLVVFVVLASCGQAETKASAVARDSAAVRIVEQGPLDALPTAPSPQLLFRLGWTDESVTFANVSTGTLLSDWSAAVIDESANTLILIAHDGVEVSRAGGPGDGPGEFRGASSVTALLGDTLLVYDRRSSRLSRFDPVGRFIDSGMWMQQGGVYSTPAGTTASHRLAWIPSSFAPRRDTQPGTVLVSGPLITSTPLGLDPDTVAEVPMVEIRYEPDRVSTDPFMRFGLGSGFQGGFVWARNDRPEIHWLSEAGDLQQVTRWEANPTPVDDAVWSRYETAYRDLMASRATRPSEEALANQLRDARQGASATLPFYTFARAARDGQVWLSDYTMFVRPSDQYVVFGSDGVAAMLVEFPRPVRILDVRGGRVLGVETNDLDVQAVVVYELDR